ncbi:MAG: hypothetical protein K6G58_04355 [Lachnospiraceae bacterium]|nr:hypothetical protein [Lachnospiraceae bacterium]
MEKLYRHYRDDGRYTVHVIPIPYYYRAYDGSFAEEVFDPDEYPPDVEISDYRTADLEGMHPDMIVIQNPFDEWNTVMSVPPECYSTALRPYTDELIYIPFFTTADFTKDDAREYINMDHYACMPGVIGADRVILPTKALKDVYIEKIMEFTGAEDDEAKAVLDERLEVQSEFVYDPGESVLSPAGAADGRKKVVFYTTVSILAEKGIEGAREIADKIREFQKSAEKLYIVWVFDGMGRMDAVDNDAAGMLERVVSEFEGMNIGEYTEGISKDKIEKYAGECESYYGIPSELALRMWYLKKPVMIMKDS